MLPRKQEVIIVNRNHKIGIVIGISTILIASVILIPIFLGGDQPESIDYGTIDYVKISVLVDNNQNGTLHSDWGLSILVETSDLTILFDAGPSSSSLEDNSESLGIDLGSTCDLVVISHEHPDHVDGLAYFSDIEHDLTLYTPSSGTSYSLHETQDWWNDFTKVRVANNAKVSTGIALVAMSYEEALVLNVENLGLVVLVGCSHPGIDNLVSKAIEALNVTDVYMVMGGFHLNTANQDTRSDTMDALIDLGVQYIYPLHCSGNDTRDYVESNYPANYEEACVGFQITLNGSA
jgi:7,8-dihydropterin-6-yl-methyl-4-(beta-D-ribofuranosyl)aminobenzene 5'-phosphate synthase